jgi:hypothetical protein
MGKTVLEPSTVITAGVAVDKPLLVVFEEPPPHAVRKDKAATAEIVMMKCDLFFMDSP